MGALFVKAVSGKSFSRKRRQAFFNLGTELISMIVPGGNMFDLKSVLKFIRYSAAERLAVIRGIKWRTVY
jgi:hypothetical protein